MATGEETYPEACSGEVCTDARGHATVSLGGEAAELRGRLDYELRPLTRGVTAAIAAELLDGRFTIVTDQPHVKVAWRVRFAQPPQALARQAKEERWRG